MTAQKESILIRKKIRHGCWNAGYYGKETEKLGVDEECCDISKPSTLKRSWVLMGREERYLGLITENLVGYSTSRHQTILKRWPRADAKQGLSVTCQDSALALKGIPAPQGGKEYDTQQFWDSVVPVPHIFFYSNRSLLP